MIVLPAILSLSTALAGPFSAKTMQGDFPVAETQRELVLPKGWLELSLATSQKVSDTYRDADGMQFDRLGGTVWRYRETSLRIEQGFSPRVTLYAHIPLVFASVENTTGKILHTRALGDVHTGVEIQPRLGTRHKLAFSADLKAPSGVEWPSDFIGGANNSSSFLTGTGVTNLGLEVHGRAGLTRNFVADLQLGYVHKFASVVGYVLETDGFGNGWFNPGDELYAHGSLTGQLGDRVSAHADLRVSDRGAHRMGVSGQSTNQVDLETLNGTEAHYTDLGGGFQVAAAENLEIRVQAMGQLQGTDSRIFAHLGLEEFSPQPGIRAELEVVLRW